MGRWLRISHNGKNLLSVGSNKSVGQNVARAGGIIAGAVAGAPEGPLGLVGGALEGKQMVDTVFGAVEGNQVTSTVKVASGGIVPGARYAIKTVHGTYLRAHPGGQGSKIDLQVDKKNWDAMPWEQFTIVKAPGGRYGIRSAHGTYLRAHPGGQGSRVDLQVDKHNWDAMPWEQFTIVNAQNGRFGLRSAHGSYLRAHPGGENSRLDLQVDKHNWDAMPWEQFELVAL